MFEDKLMVWAACLTAFFGFLRISEYTATQVSKFEEEFTLCFSDVRLNPTSASIKIKASKTDPYREGVTITIASNGTTICPIVALSAYMAIHPSGTGPLFQFADGRYLTRKGLMAVLNLIKPDNIRNMSTHSFRIGAATTAAAAGYPRWVIQALGRWKSDCYKVYTRVTDRYRKHLSAAMAAVVSQGGTLDPDNF